MATTEKTVDEAVADAEGQLGEDLDIEEVEQEAAPTTPTTEADDPLDKEVPADKLSGFWKNKAAQSGKAVTFRDLIDAPLSAEEKIRQQGEIANRATDEAKVLRAQLQTYQELLRQQAPAPAAPRPTGWEDVGMHNPTEEALRDPERFGNAAANLGARRAADQLNPRIQNVEQSLQQLQRNAELMNVRMAADTARASLDVDQATWNKLGPYLYAKAGADERGPHNPDVWKEAYTSLKEAFPQVEARRSIPAEGIMKGNPSGAARAVPTRTQGEPKQRVRGIISATELEAVKAGLTLEQARKVSQMTEEKLRRKETRES